MISFLIFMVCLFSYSLVGGISGATHHRITAAKAGHTRGLCFSGDWCAHACVSLWIAGILWPIGIPAFIGMYVGSYSREGRIERRQERELDEARHQLELAKIKRQETEELNRQLAAA